MPAAKQAGLLGKLADEVAQAEVRAAGRRSRVPAVSYPEALPVSQKKDEIARAIHEHQVVIVRNNFV